MRSPISVPDLPRSVGCGPAASPSAGAPMKGTGETSSYQRRVTDGSAALAAEPALDELLRGDATRLLRPRLLSGDAATGFGPVAFNIRARVALAAGSPEAALQDLETCAALEEGWFITTPVPLALAVGRRVRPRGARTARGGARAGRRGGRAGRRFGAARPLGLALRALAAVTGDPELLDEAVAATAATPARLEHAKALVAHGEAVRRAGRRRAARDQLREGLGLALECGATVLARRAREELHLAGGRAPHRRPEQRDELTPSERRVVARARDGMTNRAIAQAFFLTEKTVETQLRNA